MAKEVNKRVTIWVNGKEVENNVKSIRAEMLKLTNQLKLIKSRNQKTSKNFLRLLILLLENKNLNII